MRVLYPVQCRARQAERPSRFHTHEGIRRPGSASRRGATWTVVVRSGSLNWEEVVTVIRRFAAVIASVGISSMLLMALFGPVVSAQGPGGPGGPPDRPFGPPPGGPGGPMGPPGHLS